jgi:hypothetical protein
MFTLKDNVKMGLIDESEVHSKSEHRPSSPMFNKEVNQINVIISGGYEIAHWFRFTLEMNQRNVMISMGLEAHFLLSP